MKQAVRERSRTACFISWDKGGKRRENLYSRFLDPHPYGELFGSAPLWGAFWTRTPMGSSARRIRRQRTALCRRSTLGRAVERCVVLPADSVASLLRRRLYYDRLAGAEGAFIRASARNREVAHVVRLTALKRERPTGAVRTAARGSANREPARAGRPTGAAPKQRRAVARIGGGTVDLSERKTLSSSLFSSR